MRVIRPARHLAFAGPYLARNAPELAARGLLVCAVAGAARHYPAALESAAALRESRPSPRDARTGLTVLLAPAPEVALSVRQA